MQVEIVSMMAAVHGAERITWCGDVEPNPHDGDMNEALFAHFNRVTDTDGRRLADMGYNLPSLSTGDLLSWGGVTWRVDAMGFTKLTGTREGFKCLIV